MQVNAGLRELARQPRFRNGFRVVHRAQQLLKDHHVGLTATATLRNEANLNRHQAWEIGAVLYASRDHNVEAAAQRLADGILSGHLAIISRGRDLVASLDDY